MSIKKNVNIHTEFFFYINVFKSIQPAQEIILNNIKILNFNTAPENVEQFEEFKYSHSTREHCDVTA